MYEIPNAGLDNEARHVNPRNGGPSAICGFRTVTLWLLLSLMVSTGHAKKVLIDGGEDPDVKDKIEEVKDAVDEADLPDPKDGTATISGFVVYNDRRDHGLFASRRDLSGNPGQSCPFDKDADEDSACNPNWLGGRYMVVEIIELDKNYSSSESDCKKSEVIAKATVNRDGSFEATFSTYDPCGSDKLAHAAIEVRAQLKFCGEDYCFSMNRDKDKPYRVSHSMASASNPLTVKDGDDINLKWLPFQKGDDMAAPNNYSIAANYYASIVDTITTLHKDNTLPFYMDTFGEIRYVFPGKKNPYDPSRLETSTATAFSPTEIVISNFSSRDDGEFVWIPGDTPAHEYGHILMQRAWDGGYGFDGMGNSANDSEKADSPQIAFKEAWAEFISHVVFEPTMSCSKSSFDSTETTINCGAIEQNIRSLKTDLRQQRQIMGSLQGAGLEAAEERLAGIKAEITEQETSLAACRVDNRTTKLNGPLYEGASWRGNIVNALCDWYDTRDDNDTTLLGPGDHFAENDIYAMWYNLRRMYVDADKYGGEFKNPGLWFCDYVDYYLNVRKSPAEVGQQVHARLEGDIRDLIYNNNIACYMPPPT